MGILGIKNRTENWKTAECFAPFLASVSARTRLVQRLLGLPAESLEVDPQAITIELFWTGLRDYESKKEKENGKGKGKVKDKVLAGYYKARFSKLFEKINSATRKNLRSTAIGQMTPFQNLKTPNYEPDKNLAKFGRNLRNTEIDIVLETSKHLFIGEAKYRSDFGAISSYVLVHQLIRQYVTAQILLDLTQQEKVHTGKAIVPFLVVDTGKIADVKNTAQVEFMRDQKWLKEKNILTWGELALLG